MSIQFRKPMLACALLPSNVEHTDTNILAAMQKLRYPVLATIKKDGIRALRLNGSLLSRTLKPIPNRSIRERSLVLPGGFDMELWNPELSYEEIESIVMSREHPRSDLIQFHVLDWFKDDAYQTRIRLAYEVMGQLHPDAWIQSPRLCEDYGELIKYFSDTEYNGEEGICFRTLNSPYKQGRSTLKEQYLIKLCRFHTSECIIEGFEEQMENGNPDEWNDVGMMKRTSHKANMMGKDTLGALLVRDIHSGVGFRVGTGVGLDDRLRREIWMNRSKYDGTIWKYKYKGGGKNKPRSPILLGKRNEIDIVK